MSSPKLLRLHSEILLYLCQFIDDKEHILFTTSCRFLYNLIAKEPAYWKNRYCQNFCLEDWRERDWLSWFNRQDKVLRPQTSNIDTSFDPLGNSDSDVDALATLLDNCKLNASNPGSLNSTTVISYKDPSVVAYEWPDVNWYHAYYRRKLTSNVLTTGQWHMRECQLPIDDKVQLEINGMNAWGSLLHEKKGKRMWAIRHDVFSNGATATTTEDVYWKELHIPSLVGELEEQTYMEITNSFCILWGTIRLSDTMLVQDDAGLPGIHWRDNQRSGNTTSSYYSEGSPFSLVNEPNPLRKVIVSWSNMDDQGAEFIPIFIQTGEETQLDDTLPNSMGMYDDWLLTSQPCLNTLEEAEKDYRINAITMKRMHRFNVYDMRRRRWIKGTTEIYKQSSAHIQAVTVNHADILTYRWLKNMQLSDEDNAVNSDNSYYLAIEWEIYRVTAIQPAYRSIKRGKIYFKDFPISLTDEDDFNLLLDAQEYSPGYSLISIYDTNDSEIHTGGELPHSLLALVDVRHSSTSKGNVEPVWSRAVGTNLITPLCSQNIVLVQQYKLFDVLDATNGNLLQSIPCEAYNFFWPVLESVCVLSGIDGSISYFMDMSTGNTYKPTEAWLERLIATEQTNESLSEEKDTITEQNNETTTEDNTPEAEAAVEAEEAEAEETETEAEDDSKPLPYFRISCANVCMINPNGGGKYALFSMPRL